MNSIVSPTGRRTALRLMGQATAFVAVAGATRPIAAGAQQLPAPTLTMGELSELAVRLTAVPRRRGFRTVPFMLTSPDSWDQEAAGDVLTYRYRSRQMWEVTELSTPWLNLIREAMNGQVFAHGNPEFLPVAAVHGTAHLALFDQPTWDRYKLAGLTDGKPAANSFILEKPGVSAEDDLQDLEGFYGPANNNILSLQRRGAVFIACHDSIHAVARRLHGIPDFAATPADVIAADLTNGLIPGVILVPSVVAFMVELQRAGFTYAKAA
ncbi:MULTISPECIES: thiosulfate dehydrogenase [unclassified Inquilinus]|uniref:thiosulfate dehydrogenase n=1 Tax=unclassified Inquilinus TaxID=2645927 RepID=UPI003F93BC9C